MTQGTRYTVADFQQLVFNQCCELDPAILKLLQQLESQLDVTDGAMSNGGSGGNGNGGKVPMRGMGGNGRSGGGNGHAHFNKSHSNHGGGNHKSAALAKQKKVDEEDWEAVRAFKSTKLATKTGVDKRINDIRVLMNKMSPTNASTMETNIMQHLTEYNASDEKTEEADMKLVSAMLQVCISNKFYDDLFTKFYKKLVDAHPMFRDGLSTLVTDIKATELIPYVDADIDYDAYCAYNKVVDARKSKSTFVINMMKQGVVGEEVVLDVLQWYLDLIMKHIVLEGHAKEIEELAENVFVFVSKCDGAFSHTDTWNNYIMPTIQQLGCANNKQYPSISNRIIFKFKDVLDSLA